MGMSHDFVQSHVASGCNHKGLMSYDEPNQARPNRWSDCSKEDFTKWFRSTGHKCLAYNGMMKAGLTD